MKRRVRSSLAGPTMTQRPKRIRQGASLPTSPFWRNDSMSKTDSIAASVSGAGHRGFEAVREIPPQARLAQLFDYDPHTGRLTWKVPRTGGILAGSIAGTSSNGYLRVKIDGGRFSVHRVIFKLVTGEIPANIDHKDGNKTNNAWANLRPATVAQNAANQGKHSNNTTGYKGVTLHKKSGKYQAAIRNGAGAIYLGLFDAPEMAHAAYCLAAKKLHGDFARYE